MLELLSRLLHCLSITCFGRVHKYSAAQLHKCLARRIMPGCLLLALIRKQLLLLVPSLPLHSIGNIGAWQDYRGLVMV